MGRRRPIVKVVVFAAHGLGERQIGGQRERGKSEGDERKIKSALRARGAGHGANNSMAATKPSRRFHTARGLRCQAKIEWRALGVRFARHPIELGNPKNSKKFVNGRGVS